MGQTEQKYYEQAGGAGGGHVVTPFQERLVHLSLLLRRPTTTSKVIGKLCRYIFSECAMNASTLIHISGHLYDDIILLLHLNLVIPASFK